MPKKPYAKVTLAQVAAEVGVSAKTVSNALNGTGRLSASTRKSIEEAVNRLGYHINRSASTLRSGSARVLGLAIPGFGQPYCGYYCDVAAAHAHERGYGLAIATYGSNPNGLAGIVDETYRLDADGWIYFLDRPLPKSSKLLDQNYPIVVTGDYSAHGRSDCVFMPNAEAMRHVTTWLIRQKRTDFAFIGAPNGLHNDGHLDQAVLRQAMDATEAAKAQRLQGFLNAMHLAGHNAETLGGRIMSVNSLSRHDGEHAAYLLSKHAQAMNKAVPSTVLCANDALALGAMSAFGRLGLRIPEDVEVVGFDNTPDATYAIPPLTSVDSDTRQYAGIAIDRLIARIEGDTGTPTVFTTGFSIVERASTRPTS
jgi:DNA-binding LacI/PurR family transcriptional regulator